MTAQRMPQSNKEQKALKFKRAMYKELEKLKLMSNKVFIKQRESNNDNLNHKVPRFLVKINHLINIIITIVQGIK